MTFHATALNVSLTVNDLARSTDWYTNVLGFEVERSHEREGKRVAVSLKAGEARILLAKDDGAKGMNRVKGEGFSMMLTTPQNIDELAARAKENGATLDTEPTDAPWGPRIFRLRDPDGFRFTISS
ncbi:MAG: VOC family protein [Thermoanaerobaculia bacterium]